MTEKEKDGKWKDSIYPLTPQVTAMADPEEAKKRAWNAILVSQVTIWLAVSLCGVLKILYIFFIFILHHKCFVNCFL